MYGVDISLLVTSRRSNAIVHTAHEVLMLCGPACAPKTFRLWTTVHHFFHPTWNGCAMSYASPISDISICSRDIRDQSRNRAEFCTFVLPCHCQIFGVRHITRSRTSLARLFPL